MMIEGTNGLMILLATAAGIGVGMVWYAPPVFGKVWQVMSGLPADSKPGIQTFVYWILSYLVLTITMAYLYNHMGVNTPYQGLRWGLTLGIAIIGPAMAGSSLFGRRPVKLFLIDLGNISLAMGVMGAIIAMGR